MILKNPISERIEKLGTIRSFNLPPIETCPFATEACKQYCYATKGRNAYPASVALRKSNLELAKGPDFVDTLCHHLSKNERYFRIHSSGDFFSIEYFLKWKEIAKIKHWITFLAYTRNANLFRIDRPENLVLIYSCDTIEQRDEFKKAYPYERTAIVIPCRYKSRPHLSALTVTTRICNSQKCDKCFFCWDSGFNIAFPQQWKKYDT